MIIWGLGPIPNPQDFEIFISLKITKILYNKFDIKYLLYH